MKSKKYICLGLAILTLTCFGLAACARSGDPSEHGTTGSSTLDNKETDLESETDVKNLLPEAIQYDGDEFIFLTVSHTWQAYDQMFYPELTGDRVSDAIYERNTIVSELLDITISEQYSGDGMICSDLRLDVVSGENAYDAAICSTADANTMYIAGTITEMDLALDLEAPWWYQAFNNYVNINEDGKKFIAYGKINLMSYVGCTMVFAANTELVDRYNLEDPYTVYQEGRWTLDHLYANSQVVAEDLNGDGLISDYTKDQVGSIGVINQFSLLLCCSGEDLAVRKGDSYVLQASERFFDVYDKIVEIVTDETSYWDGIPGKQSLNYWTIFNEGRGLYMSNAIAAFQSAREGEIPYVLLPYPKADMGQKDYYNVISNFVAGTVMPAGQSEDDIERIGMVLDYLGAYSEPIFEAFVENTLYYKYAKDLESVTVFSSIMENIPFCELGILYDWGQIRTKLDDAVATKTPIASKMKAWEKPFNRAATTSMGNRK